MEIYGQLQMQLLRATEPTPELSQSSAPDFPANPTALRERVWGIVTSVTSGQRLQELSQSFVRAGSSVKIRPVYSQGRINGTSIEYSLTYPRWGILSLGECGELATSERLISETACSSAHSETFPTPLSSDAVRVRYSQESLYNVGLRRTNGEYKKAGCNLSEYVAVFPTPLASEKKKGGKNQTSLSDFVGSGKLNPAWVEWLMNFPIGWTEVE